MTDKKEEFEQVLKDAGCNNELINECVELLNTKQTEKIFILLSKHRKNLLETLHQKQNELEILDYLIFNLNKNNF